MNIQKIIQDYLEQPLPLWENEITNLLVEFKWAELASQSHTAPNTYTIVGCVIKDLSVDEINMPLSLANCDIKIELPSENLKGFYVKHGIEPVEVTTTESSEETAKVLSALAMLRHIAPVYDFILKIVKSIQLIKAEYSETDVSYSHPEIPFSIFFSICEEVSIISDLRVAESILHEAMHLKLTLIENHIDLIQPDSKETFYSPWREEERPLRGVLHGIFVFKAIKDFYNLLIPQYQKNPLEIKFIKFRIHEIEKDFETLKAFPSSQGLSNYGKLFASKLL